MKSEIFQFPKPRAKRSASNKNPFEERAATFGAQKSARGLMKIKSRKYLRTYWPCHYIIIISRSRRKFIAQVALQSRTRVKYVPAMDYVAVHITRLFSCFVLLVQHLPFRQLTKVEKRVSRRAPNKVSFPLFQLCSTSERRERNSSRTPNYPLTFYRDL